MNQETEQQKLHHVRIGKMYSQQLKDAKRRKVSTPDYTREEFTTWLYAQSGFQTVLDMWDAHDNDSAHTLSVSLIDKSKAYTLDNLVLNNAPKKKPGCDAKSIEIGTEITNQEINKNFHQSSASNDKTETSVEAVPTKAVDGKHLTETEYTEEQQLKMHQAEAVNLGYQVQAAGTQFAILAAKTGEALSNVKDGLKHGEYEPWVKNNMSIGISQCKTYVKLAKDCPYLLDSNGQSTGYLGVASELLLSHLPSEKIDETRKAIANKGLNQKQSADLISKVQAGENLQIALHEQEENLRAEYDQKYQDALTNDQDKKVKARLKTAVENQTKELAKEKDTAVREKERFKTSHKIVTDVNTKQKEHIAELAVERNELQNKLDSLGSIGAESEETSLEIDRLTEELESLKADHQAQTEQLASRPTDQALLLMVQAKGLIQEAFNAGDLSDSAISVQTDIFEMTVPRA